MATAYNYENEDMKVDDVKLIEIFNNYESVTQEEIDEIFLLINIAIKHKYRNPDIFIPIEDLPLKEYLYHWLLIKDFLLKFKNKSAWEAMKIPNKPTILAFLFKECDNEEIEFSNVSTDAEFYEKVQILRKRLENNEDCCDENGILFEFAPKIMILKWLFTDNPNTEWYTECEEQERKRSITKLKLNVRLILRDLGLDRLFGSPLKTAEQKAAERALIEQNLAYLEPNHSFQEQLQSCSKALFQEDRKEENEPKLLVIAPVPARFLAPLKPLSEFSSPTEFEPSSPIKPLSVAPTPPFAPRQLSDFTANLPDLSFLRKSKPVREPLTVQESALEPALELALESVREPVREPAVEVSDRSTPSTESLNRDFEELSVSPEELSVSPKSLLGYDKDKYRSPEKVLFKKMLEKSEEKKKEAEIQKCLETVEDFMFQFDEDM